VVTKQKGLLLVIAIPLKGKKYFHNFIVTELHGEKEGSAVALCFIFTWS